MKWFAVHDVNDAALRPCVISSKEADLDVKGCITICQDGICTPPLNGRRIHLALG